MNNYLNMGEAMDYLQVSKWKLSKMIENGELSPKRFSRGYRQYYLFNPHELVIAKRKLIKNGYKYKYA